MNVFNDRVGELGRNPADAVEFIVVDVAIVVVVVVVRIVTVLVFAVDSIWVITVTLILLQHSTQRNHFVL